VQRCSVFSGGNKARAESPHQAGAVVLGGGRAGVAGSGAPAAGSGHVWIYLLHPAAAGLLGRPIRGDPASPGQDPHAPLCPSASATVATVATWALLIFRLQLHSLAAGSRGHQDLGLVGRPRFLVVRASGFDDGEASFGFRDYF